MKITWKLHAEGRVDDRRYVLRATFYDREQAVRVMTMLSEIDTEDERALPRDPSHTEA